MIAILFASLLWHPCWSDGVHADPICTPGAVDPIPVAQLCSESTRTRRHVSESTKRAVFAEYGIYGEERRRYVIDHRVPLEIGGGNDIRNLWPELRDAAERKDRLEDKARRDVCSGRVTLGEAQGRFR